MVNNYKTPSDLNQSDGVSLSNNYIIGILDASPDQGDKAADV